MQSGSLANLNTVLHVDDCVSLSFFTFDNFLRLYEKDEFLKNYKELILKITRLIMDFE